MMMMITRITAALAFAVLLGSGTLAIAAEADHANTEAGHEAAEGHGRTKGLPASVVYQGINFVIFAGLGYFFLRKPIRAFFNGRQGRYHAALNKAEAARREAEAKRQEIVDKLRVLETSTQQTLAQARVESEALSARILQDANDMARSIREEANRTAQAEINRAKEQLRDDLLAQSVHLSKQILGERMVDTDQKRLQTEFVDKIQEVR